MQALIGIFIIVVLFSLNAWLYVKNKNTPVPEGCENLRPDCHACGIRDCAMRQQFVNGREEKNGNS